MLTREQLVALHRSLTDERVLSVYIDGTAADPANQRAWRVQLERGLKELRTWVADSSRDERLRLERCIRLLDGELAAFGGGVGAPGWVAFITPAGAREVHALPVRVPTLVVWSTGACVGPYTRVLKETRPVVVAIADARRVMLYRYVFGAAERIEAIRAHHPISHPSHMGTTPRRGFHTGTRGIAGHDAAQRSLLSGRDRMLAEAVDRIRELAGVDGWIVLGGVPRVVARLVHQLSDMAPRVLERTALDVHVSEAVIADAARAGASALRNAADARALREAADLANAGGLGVVGSDSTSRALEQSCVRELYLTRAYCEAHPADAEDAVRAALDQDALVTDVSGDAASWLDAHGGMAARLRFRVLNAESAWTGGKNAGAALT